MKPVTSTARLLAAASMVALCVSSNAVAQTAKQNAGTSSTQSAPPAASPDIADIIVTAQRVDTSLSKTPVAVAVISADTLAKAQIVSEQDLRSAAPGLSVRAGLNSNQLNYALRGQSQDAYSNTRPGVLPYLNDVQIDGGGGSTAFYDLQSVQILKGPQGTLFGRSATGGAVLFTTQKPTNEFGGYASALYGNYNAVKLEGAVNAPLISDTLLARVAGFYQSRDGYQYNTTTNSYLGGVNRYGVRGSLTANLGDVKNELVVDYLHSNGSNVAGVLNGLLPFNGPGTAPYVPAALLYGGTSTPTAIAQGVGTYQALLAQLAGVNLPTAVATAAYTAYFADPNHPATGLTAFLATQKARGPYIASLQPDNAFQGRNVIVTNTTSLSFGANATLKNIFGYTHLITNTGADADGSPYSIAANQFPTGGETNLGAKITTRQVSDELQLSGKTLEGRLDYVTGFYFSDEKVNSYQINYDFDIFGGPPAAIDADILNRTYAGFGQATYHLNSSGLAATGGLRYTSERVEKQVLPSDHSYPTYCLTAVPGYSCDKSATYNRLSWTVGLEDQIDPSTLVYAVSRRAYKSGGFNATSVPKDGTAANSGDAYIDERVTDAELGAKYSGFLGNMSLRTSLALYYDWDRNSQRTAFGIFNGGPAAQTVNVPEGTTYGLEFEAQIRPVQWLNVGGTFNYTHATFGNAPVATPLGPVIYDQVPDTPKTSGTIFAEVSTPLSSILRATVHGDVYAQSTSFESPQSSNNIGTVIPGYAIADFRIGVENAKVWSLTANLKNAFNRVYFVGGLPVGQIFQANTAVPGEPRMFTVEARIKF